MKLSMQRQKESARPVSFVKVISNEVSKYKLKKYVCPEWSMFEIFFQQTSAIQVSAYALA